MRSNSEQPELYLDPVVVQGLSDIQELASPDVSHANIYPSLIARIQNSDSPDISSEDKSVSTSEGDIHNEIIDNCESFLEEAKEERKAIGRKTRPVSRAVKRTAIKKPNGSL